MDCPKCKYPSTEILETRQEPHGDSIRRRRQCMRCGFRVTTQEIVKPPKVKGQKDAVIS